MASRRLRVFAALAGNRGLRRVVAGYALFILAEYAVWIAMLVYAYDRGGATIAGVVALAQLAPAALLAPLFAALADRRSPAVLLAAAQRACRPRGRTWPGGHGGTAHGRRGEPRPA